jgi:hypothetical protein
LRLALKQGHPTVSKPRALNRRAGETPAFVNSSGGVSQYRQSIQTQEASLGRPKWEGLYAGDWEILLYERGGGWEACFFKWDIYHEHVTGDSLDEARRAAEARIDALEGRCAPPTAGGDNF